MLDSVKDACSGCSACASICPKQAITMEPNSEGFLYPAIANSLCVKCGLCEKTCPILNPFELDISKKPVAYAVQNKDELVRNDSTSGGAFSAIAQYVLDRKGVVFGAMFDSNFDVVHGSVETKEKLSKLRRSKYVQSRIGNTYKQAKEFLDSGWWVCFSGTPCQIGGFKKFLRKDYEQLITVDIICHSVPSPKMWSRYKQTQEEKFKSKIQNICFREKAYGFSNPTLTIHFNSGTCYRQGSIDPYLGAFTGGMVRKSCSQCAFKTWTRASDFTIYDCWSIGKFNSQMDDNKGTSGFLIHSSKAKIIFESLKQNFNIMPLDVEKTLNGDGIKATDRAHLHPSRDAFFRDLDRLNFYELKKKYYSATPVHYFTAFIKPWVYKMGFLKKLNNLKGIAKR